jgi:hypothetical protein
MWIEAAVALTQVVADLPGGTEENHVGLYLC